MIIQDVSHIKRASFKLQISQSILSPFCLYESIEVSIAYKKLKIKGFMKIEDRNKDNILHIRPLYYILQLTLSGLYFHEDLN